MSHDIAPTFMRAAFFRKHGPPTVMEVGELPQPRAGAGEVLVRVGATSLNHLDLWVRRGLPISIPLPHVGGSDVAGTVAEVGAGVEGVVLGTRVVVDPSLHYEWYTVPRAGPGLRDAAFQVVGEHVWGGMAELAVVPAANLLSLPSEVSFETAAGGGLVAVTAYRALFTRGGLRPGERVLISGGSGGVSTLAIQMARAAGARVVAITSGQENVRRLEALGAHMVLDRTTGEVAGLVRDAVGREGVDLAVDSVGEALWGALVRSLRPGGRLVTYGATTGPRAQVDLRHIFWKQLSVIGSTMGDPTDFRRAMSLIFARQVEPVVQEVIPLEEVRRAHELLESGGVFGKLVLVPDSGT
ncbi:MAG: zinc-binding dehydrogenase [Gemmatimonadota bacterium]